MPQITYKNLYQQVIDEINKRSQYTGTESYNEQMARTAISPLTGNAVSDTSLAEVITAVQNIIRDTVAPRIIEGFTVEETDPVSSSVIVKAGKGGIAGHLYELTEDTEIQIPFDGETSVFYINIYLNSILVEFNEHPEHLTIAKIVVPQPTKTPLLVYSQNQEDWNPYIVNFQEYKLYGDDNGLFEEDTIGLLRNNISPILADNIIGNIRLSENLKILNTAGTLELNSDSLKLSDPNGTVLTKLNKDGTFFYDEDGIEIAKFSTDEARVGNIRVTKNSIESTNFVSGALGSGFQINDNGNAEFNDVLVRGKITTSIFEKDTVSAIGGSLLVSEADVLDVAMTSADNSELVLTGDMTLSIGDVVRIKDGTDDEWMEVTAVNGDIYTVNRDKAGNYVSNSNPAWQKGTGVVNFGQSGEGLIYLTSSEVNSPYISFVTHTGSPWSSLTTKSRLGKLDGITDATFGALSGFGLYGDNVYLHGMMALEGTLGTPTGTGLYMGGERFGYYDSVAAEWKVSIENDGSFLFKGSGDNYLEWDGAVLTIRGILNGEDITVGTITADKIDTTELSAIAADLGTITGGSMTGVDFKTAASGARFVIDADTSVIAYDDSDDETLKILLSGTDVGDLIIGDVGTGTNYLKWDKSAGTLTFRGNGQTEFRTGDMMLSSNTSAPTGWTDVSATYNDKFIRISSSTPLSTGGGTGHTHGLGSHIHAMSGSTDAGTTEMNTGGNSGYAPAADVPHVHTLSGNTAAASGDTASASDVPAYVQMRIFKKD